MNDLYNQISLKYEDMTRSEKKLADYFLVHRPNIQSVTISAIAQSCDVSTATLTRFVRMLGCENFIDFRTRLSVEKLAHQEQDADLYGSISPEDSIEVKCGKLSHICAEAVRSVSLAVEPEAITTAVDLLWNANAVYCFGQGSGCAVALDATTRFSTISPKFHWVSDSHLQACTASLLREKDVVLYFAFSGTTREFLETAQLIRESPGKLILVTRTPNSPGAIYADTVLLCKIDESPRNQGSIAAKIGQLFLIDLLYNEYISRDADLVSRDLAKTMAAIDEKRL